MLSWFNVVYVQCFVCDQLFGCDGVLRSGKAQDVCGVCDGDGSTCSLTSDSYRGGQAKGDKLLDNSPLQIECSQASVCLLETKIHFFLFSQQEYSTFLTLPVNATQVHLVNMAPLFTHLGN